MTGFAGIRVRVKAPTRAYGPTVPDDAVPGDLVVGNRGAAARVVELGPGRPYLILDYVGNWYDGVRPSPGCKMYDRRGGT